MKWIVPAGAVLALLVLFWAIGCYNRLQALRAAAMSALQQLATAIGQRNHMAERLVATLDGNLQHERAVLAQVQAGVHRSAALAEAAAITRGNREAMQALAAGEAQVGEGVWNLRNLCAAYPELVVNEALAQQWIELDAAIAGCQFAVEQYNQAAAAFAAASRERPAAWLAQALYFPPFGPLQVGRSDG
jgi:LemA protein